MSLLVVVSCCEYLPFCKICKAALLTQGNYQHHSFFLFSQFVYQEALVTTICDMYPAFFQSSCRRKLLLLAISVGSFLVGLLMVTEVSGESPRRLYFVTHVARSTNYQNETSVYLLHLVAPALTVVESPVQNKTLEIQFRSDAPSLLSSCIALYLQ